MNGFWYLFFLCLDTSKKTMHMDSTVTGKE